MLKAPNIDYMAPIQLPFELDTPVYGAMLAIWQLRKPLQRQFPLHKEREIDYRRFLGWCTLHGRKEYKILHELPEWHNELTRKAELPELADEPYGKTFNRAMLLCGITRNHGSTKLVEYNRSARKYLFRWYWREGRIELGLDIPLWQLERLGQQFQWNLTEFLLMVVPRELRKQVPTRADELVTEYQLDEVASYFSEKVASCSNSKGNNGTLKNSRHTLWDGIPLVASSHFEKMRSLLNRSPSITGETQVMQRLSSGDYKKSEIRHPFGVNLFGYAHGEIGIGEDVRMLAITLDRADIPFCVINIKPGNNVSQNDRSVEHWMSDTPKYGINVFCVTGVEHLRYYLEQGSSVFKDRHTIGLWPWELPSWPKAKEHTYGLVNEIWGISAHTASAYARSPKPVNVVPLPVCVENTPPLDRKYFGLPEDSYLFVFAFDMLSTPTRKNPMAVIEAFKRAFPKSSSEKVGLVLKINHFDDNRLTRWRLKQKIGQDKRIIIVDGTLPRPKVLALYRNCDCFVSLHRAEGFGRCMVESLMLGLDVVMTGYSGNLEYRDAEQVSLVDYQLRPLKKRDYFLSHAQSWADPCIDDAAEKMHKKYEKRDNERTPYLRYCPTQLKQDYRQRINDIFETYSE